MAREGIEKIIPVGHDWGSAFAQRVYLYRREKCSGLITLNVAYLRPSSTPYYLDTVNKMTEQAFGYPCYAYWNVFAADDGPEILLKNVETLFHAIHWEQPEAMKTFFCTHGSTRKLLQTASPSDFPRKPYAQAAGFKDAFIDRMKRDGFEGPQCWYRAMARNVNLEDESKLSTSRR